MPELPEVETVRRGLEPVMHGATIINADQNRPDLRFPFSENFVARIKNCKITEIKRRSKYLIFVLDNDLTIISHLGMSGSFRILKENSEDQLGDFAHEKSKDGKHDHFVFHLDKDGHRAKVIYNDPRRFGFMLLVPLNELDEHAYFKDLGPEPTGNGVSSEYLAQKLQTKSAPMKSVLLDQRIIAGLGNIYVCEALWRARISPERKASTLVTKGGKPSAKLSSLTTHIHDVIGDAIRAGGSTLNDHIQTDGKMGYFQHQFNAYGQEGERCQHENCKGVIARITQSGRSSFYCPKCQT
ncbi:MAG: bifunctional DNA-formamidopyrimidine glycosylase/DNA-(apurinic or apyrimidinic site) lyase [Lentilitoribacter sp.]